MRYIRKSLAAFKQVYIIFQYLLTKPQEYLSPLQPFPQFLKSRNLHNQRHQCPSLQELMPR